MPTSGPLVDRYGRIHDDLRLSVTDRCNFRCVYCMPEEGMVFRARQELLTFDELLRVARIARDLGVRSVRLTGGEPLVRRGVVGFVRRLAALGFEDLAMTTNGTRLVESAEALSTGGLRRVNISCDSLRPERFAAIRRRGELGAVLDAMAAAESAGLGPVKVNVVLIAGVNDDEILDFAAFGREHGRIVRFIEFMPLDAPGEWSRSEVVPGEQVVRAIDAVWPIEPVHAGGDDSAPAQRFRFLDGRGEIGLISSVTQPFCGTCNRLRITADGAIRNCLFSDDELSIRDWLRDGAPDDEIATLLRRAVWGKLPGHGINDPGFLRPRRSMSMIGG
jgi:cyclic pyranopterin phosphate synthase